MLQIKNLKNLGELQELFSINNKASDTIVDIYDRFAITRTAKSLNQYKEKGYPAVDTLLTLLLLPMILVSSVRALILSGCVFFSQAQKDVYYRLKNNENINWRLLLYSFSKRFKKLSIDQDQGENDSKVKCFIIDDTFLPKTGEKIEYIGKVFDHVTQRHLLGFKALVLALFDGKTTIGIDVSLHNEKGKRKKYPYGLSKKKLKARYSKKRDSASAVKKRANELSDSKIDNALKMLKRAVKNGFVAKYVLMDKWFISDQVFKTVRGIKKVCLHVIAACKMDRRKYTYYGKEYTAKELLKKNKKLRHYSRKLKAHYIEVIANYKGTEVKLFFNRTTRRGNWELLISSNIKLTFIKAMEIYSIRWSIEVFFKECKQYLGLGKCQSQDFGAQIADITICMIQYLILSLYKRKNSYETIGGIFKNSQWQLVELTVAERLWSLFLTLQRKIAEVFTIDINELITRLIKIDSFDEQILKFLCLLGDEQEGKYLNNA